MKRTLHRLAQGRVPPWPFMRSRLPWNAWHKIHHNFIQQADQDRSKSLVVKMSQTLVIFFHITIVFLMSCLLTPKRGMWALFRFLSIRWPLCRRISWATHGATPSYGGPHWTHCTRPIWLLAYQVVNWRKHLMYCRRRHHTSACFPSPQPSFTSHADQVFDQINLPNTSMVTHLPPYFDIFHPTSTSSDRS